MTSRTKVVIAVESEAYRGPDVYVEYLLRYLPQDYELIVVAAHPVPLQFEKHLAEMGITSVVVRGVRRLFDPMALIDVTRALRRIHPDLVHIILRAPPNNRHALAACLLLRYPMVATLHGWIEVASGFRWRVLRTLYRRLKRVIAVSEEMRGQLMDILHVPGERTRLIGNGVEVTEPTDRSWEPPLRLVAVGALVHFKGFDLLIEAMRELRDTADIELVIAGEGPERATLEAAARGLPIRFLGFVEDISVLLASADILCIPSRWEGLPFVLLEAMMNGLPIVATTVGDIPRVVGDTALLVSPGDVDQLVHALRSLTSSPEECSRLGHAARERAIARFSATHMATATANVYEEVIRRR